MKILWIVNIIFPYPAMKINKKKTVLGGWLNGLANNIKNVEEIELAIATVYNGKKLLEFNDGEMQYYLIPRNSSIKYNSKTENFWKEVNQKFKPNLVHIHGTEYPYGLEFINACPNVKSVVSIQGLVSEYAKVYYGNMSTKDIIKNITFRDIVKRSTIFQQRQKFEKRGRYEVEIIKKADAIIGRTTWDYANCKAIKNDIKYYSCNEILRDNFYKKEWDFKEIERHTLFCSQAIYPIKGLHYLIYTVSILKKQYKDIKLYIAGWNILDDTTIKKKIKKTGYAKYIQKLVRKYELQKNIIFTGLLNENQMIDRLLKTNVFVLPSAIENSSNSLGEAMLLGIPCVASNTGGTMDMLEHKKEGLIYTYTEPAICAEYISRLFEDDNLARQFGENAKKRAERTHNRIENVNSTIKIYKEILGEK